MPLLSGCMPLLRKLQPNRLLKEVELVKGRTLVGLGVLAITLGLAGCGENSPTPVEKKQAPTVVEEVQTATAPVVKEEQLSVKVDAAPEVKQKKQEGQVTAAPVVDNSYILVTKSSFSLHYFNNEGQETFAAGCALGKNPGQKTVSGDMKTPTGTFVVDEILDSSWWTHDFGDGKGEIAGAYGPYFISLNTDELSKGSWGGIGIHGTHDPASIGTRASEGCIRLRNEDVAKLRPLVHVGMKVVITE